MNTFGNVLYTLWVVIYVLLSKVRNRYVHFNPGFVLAPSGYMWVSRFFSGHYTVICVMVARMSQGLVSGANEPEPHSQSSLLFWTSKHNEIRKKGKKNHLQIHAKLIRGIYKPFTKRALPSWADPFNHNLSCSLFAVLFYLFYFINGQPRRNF